MYAENIVSVVDSGGCDLQTMLEVVQMYMMSWQMKFNSSSIGGVV